MNRTVVLRAMKRAGIREDRVEQTLLGVEVIRAGNVMNIAPLGPNRFFRTNFGGHWHAERWRIQCGSGIAGMSGVWHMRLVSNPTELPGFLGPFTTQDALVKALRLWKQWEIP